MDNIDKLATGLMTGGLAGVAVAAMNNKPAETEKKSTPKNKSSFTNTNKDDELLGLAAGLLIFVVIFLIVCIILIIFFLVAIYKMMPSYKALHVIMTLLLGAFWYMPVLIYYCVSNDYVLSTSGPALNNRGRNYNRNYSI